MLQYGNHKSAKTEKSHLLSMLQEEVLWMWQLLVPLKALLRVPRGFLAPLAATGATSQPHGEPPCYLQQVDTLPIWSGNHVLHL